MANNRLNLVVYISLVVSSIAVIVISVIAGYNLSLHHWWFAGIDVVLAIFNITLIVLNAKMRGRREVYEELLAKHEH